MKRKIAGILGLIVCGLAGVALTYERPLMVDFTSDPVPSPVQNTRVRVALYDWTENLEIRNVIEQYNQHNSDHIEIEMMDISTDVYNDTLNMLLTSGQGPDVFSADNAWLATYVNKNYLENLSGYLGPGDLDRYPEWAIDYAQRPIFKGGIYFLPASVETVRLIYNKELLRSAGARSVQAPRTFAEMQESAKRVGDAGVGLNKYGFALPAGDSQHSLQAGLEMASTYSGIYLYDYRSGRYDLSGYEPWLQMMLEMKRQGSLYPGESLLKRDTALRQFAEGNIGMMYVTSKDYVKLQEYMPKDEWEVAPPPAVDRSSIGAGALMMVPESPLVVNASSSSKEEAVKVWKFLQSKDFLSSLFSQALALPSVDGIIASAELNPRFSHFKDFYPQPYDSIYPLSPQIMDQYDPNTVSNEPRNSGDRPRMQLYLQIIAGGKPLRQALQDETKRLNQMLDIADTGYFFKREEYIFPEFDPQHPLDRRAEAARGGP